MPTIKTTGMRVLAAITCLSFSACNHGTTLQTSPVQLAGPPAASQQSPAPATTPGPAIKSYTTSATVLTAGETAMLSWNVTGADTVSISPFPGIVKGNSVRVSPKSTTKFTIAASGSGKTATRSLNIQVLGGSAGDWNVKESPPAMSSPKLVDASKVSPSRIDAQTLNCAGSVREIRLKDSEDAVVYMSGAKALRHPLWITGGRNVRVVGLAFQIDTQPGCGIGELPNSPVSKHVNKNIHPRVPGAMALRLQQAGTTFVEGLNIDLRGHEADCIVSRNPDSMTPATARKVRDVVVQNTYCSGIEGLGASKIGDGVHGDFFQNQGNDVLRRLVFENVSVRSSQEGIVLHGDSKAKVSGARDLVVRRYDYSWDPRYVGDDSYETFGLALDARPDAGWKIEDIRIDDYRDGADYIMIGNQRYGNSPAGNVKPHPQIRSGLPSTGAFASPQKTGLSYRSPHGGVPNG